MSWHVETEVLHRYQSGAVDRVTAASVESHVTGCPECRDDLTVDSDWLEQSWTDIADRIEPGQPTIIERVLTWVGVPSHLARVMVVTPSLRPSWLIAVTLALVFAGLASRLAAPGSLDLFLVVAPLVPVAGVAVAYGRVADPAHEITTATPIDPLRLLLLRAAAVTAFAVVLSLALDVFISSTRATGLWILPALALTLTTLALGIHLSMWMAAAVSAGGWVTLVAILESRQENLNPVFGIEVQLTFVAVALIGALIFVQGRDAYRRGEEK